jgi:hypothetical protein
MRCQRRYPTEVLPGYLALIGLGCSVLKIALHPSARRLRADLEQAFAGRAAHVRSGM